MNRLPFVAIVGRPNVGKSTLFNRLAGKKIAIVHGTPGVTRDRNYAKVESADRVFSIIDTGGFEPVSKDRFLMQIAEQTQLAIEEADLIIFLVDGQNSLTATDHEIAEKLRKSGKRIVIVVNKIDSAKHDHLTGSFYALGLGDPMAISSEHNRGIEELLIKIISELPHYSEVRSENFDTSMTKIALIGKPNVGKSSLFNALLGMERVLVDEQPGTTRDAIDTMISYDQRPYLLIDTAGIRRKGRVSQRLEKYSVIMALKNIERCDISLILLDAMEGVTEQDLTVAGYAHEQGRANILAVNKWDKICHKGNRKKEILEEIRWRFKFLPYSPVVFISALTGEGINRIFPLVEKVWSQFSKRITTSKLNKFLEEIVTHYPPPSSRGKAIRLHYLTQVSVCPPTFVIFCNNYEGVHLSYLRFIQNKLREKFGFQGTPLRLFLREQ